MVLEIAVDAETAEAAEAVAQGLEALCCQYCFYAAAEDLVTAAVVAAATAAGVISQELSNK